MMFQWLARRRRPTRSTPSPRRAAASLLDAIGAGEVTVGELVDRLGLSQPQVSKHLGVLRAVGLVLVRADGRHRWYRVNGPALKPIHDWVRSFERTWNTRLDRLDDLLAELKSTGGRPHEHRHATATAPPSSRSRPTRDPHHAPVRRSRRARLQGLDHARARASAGGASRPRNGWCATSTCASAARWRYVTREADGTSRSASTASTARSRRRTASSRPRSSRAFPTPRRRRHHRARGARRRDDDDHHRRCTPSRSTATATSPPAWRAACRCR